MPKFKVEGMTCAHCQRAVTNAVHQIDPLATVNVELATGVVETNSQAQTERLADAIRAEGYQVEPLAT